MDFATFAPGYGQLQPDDVLMRMNESYFGPGGCRDQQLACYAAEQADIRRAMIQSYQHIWNIPITEAVIYSIDQDQEDVDIVGLPEHTTNTGEDDDADMEGTDDSDGEDGFFRLGDDSDDE